MSFALVNQKPGPREFAAGALFGAALVALVALHIGQQSRPVAAVEEAPGFLLADPAVEPAPSRDLKDSITPSTILGPTFSNR